MSIVKKRRVGRKWNKEWEKKYFHIAGKDEDSQYLICYQTVSEKKEGKLERHFSSKHKNYAEKYSLGSQSQTDKFNRLQRGLAQEQSVFKLQRGKTEALNVALNIVSWEIVRHMKSFTDGEFIKERMIKVAAQLFPDKADIQRAFKDIPLSARTVARRADMLSSNIDDQLDDDKRKLEFVTLSLDE